MNTGASKPRVRAVGYVYRDVPSCDLDAAPHRHAKLGDRYVCTHALVWCERCGVPREVLDSVCAGCAHMSAVKKET